MADTSIVQGLFGVDPSMYQQQQAAIQNAQAEQFAQLSAAQQGQYGAFRGGQMAGNAAANLMGMQDPMLAKATMAKQLASQFDLSTSDGLKQYAQALSQNGAPDLAQMAFARSQDVTSKSLANEQAQLNVNKVKMSTEQEAKMREELSGLPANASDDQILSVIKKYAGANDLLKILEMKQIKMGMLAAKNAPIMEAARLQKEASVSSAIDGLALVEDVKKRTSDWTAGLGNTLLSKVPLSAAKDYAADLETLKSKLGADVLAEMKAQSKTGATGLGALNMAELKMVQTKIANIDPGQSPAQVQKNLNEIERYYQKRAGLPVNDRISSGDKNPVTTSANQEALNWIQANPNDPRVPAIKKKLGIQ
jgi:hypothetical protein